MSDLDAVVSRQLSVYGRSLEDELRSDVVSYMGAILPAAFQPFRNFIDDVKAASNRTDDALTIVLRTPGGSVETTDRFVTVVRHHYKTVNFVVPDQAMSAGTIFCMSGDRIYMDYASSLGPIDPQVAAPDGSGYIPALGYLDKVAEITMKQDLSPADVVFLRSMDLAKLALYEQARDLSIDLLKAWLVRYKFKDWHTHRTHSPGSPVTSEEKTKRAEEIAAALSDHHRWYSHGRALDIAKLNELRIDIDDYSEINSLSQSIRNYSNMLISQNERLGRVFHLHSCTKEVY